MSVLKSKSSILLIIGLIVIVLLIPVWYIMLAPSVIASEIEKMESTTSYTGTLGKEEYTQFLDDIIASEIERTDMITSYEGTLYYSDYGLGKPAFPILVEAHVYAGEAKGDSVVLNIEAKMMNMTDADNPNILDEFSYNLTYVINKFTLLNVPDAPGADKNRTGYDPLYPQHLEIDEDIPNVWLDNLNITATLDYRGKIEEEGLELHKYFVNETITKELSLPFGLRNVTLTSAKTLLVEPLSGVLAYTENETLIAWMGWKQEKYYLKLVHLTYKSTPEAKTEGIELAKKNHDDLELLELMHSVSTIQIQANAKAIGAEGDNVIVEIDAQMTRIDTGENLPDFAQHSIYAFNKFTRKNDPDAADADKPRSGCDPLYPSHLRKDQNITTWFDIINSTATLKFVESIEEEGVTLYKYSGNKKITDVTFMGFADSTLSLMRTVLIEPISGLPAYTEEETFSFNTTRTGYPPLPIVYLTYESTIEAKTEGIELAQTSYDGIQLLESYLPMIFGVVAIILAVTLTFNIRRLKRKMMKAKSQPARH